MNSIDEIQEKISLIGALIDAPKNYWNIKFDPQGDGTPYVKMADEKFHYLVEEKGFLFEERVTDDLDTLLYWLVRDVIKKMAADYELKNRNSKFDSRRIIFDQELNLMKKIKESWYNKTKEEIEETLKNSPYIDT